MGTLALLLCLAQTDVPPPSPPPPPPPVALDAPLAGPVAEPAEPEVAARPPVASLTDEWAMSQEIAWATAQQRSLAGPLAMMISGYGVLVVGLAIDAFAGIIDLSVSAASSFGRRSYVPDPTPYVVGSVIAAVGLAVGVAGIPWLLATIKQRGPYARRISAIEERRDALRAPPPGQPMPPLSFAF